MARVRTSAGICLHRRGRTAVILTADGSFVEGVLVKKELPSVGDITEVRTGTNARRGIIVASAAALAAFLLLGYSAMWPGQREVHAWVSLDVGGGVEAAIDRSGRIVSVIMMEPDGSVSEPSESWRGRSLEEFAERFVQESLESSPGDPSEEGPTVLITTSPGSPKAKEALAPLAERCDLAVRKALEKAGVKGSVVAAVVPARVREQAKVEAVSPGRFLVWTEASERGMDLSLDDLRIGDVSASIRRAGGDPEIILNEIRKPKEAGQYVRAPGKPDKDSEKVQGRNGKDPEDGGEKPASGREDSRGDDRERESKADRFGDGPRPGAGRERGEEDRDEGREDRRENPRKDSHKPGEEDRVPGGKKDPEPRPGGKRP